MTILYGRYNCTREKNCTHVGQEIFFIFATCDGYRMSSVHIVGAFFLISSFIHSLHNSSYKNRSLSRGVWRHGYGSYYARVVQSSADYSRPAESVQSTDKTNFVATWLLCWVLENSIDWQSWDHRSLVTSKWRLQGLPAAYCWWGGREGRGK